MQNHSFPPFEINPPSLHFFFPSFQKENSTSPHSLKSLLFCNFTAGEGSCVLPVQYQIQQLPEKFCNYLSQYSTFIAIENHTYSLKVSWKYLNDSKYNNSVNVAVMKVN